MREDAGEGSDDVLAFPPPRAADADVDSDIKADIKARIDLLTSVVPRVAALFSLLLIVAGMVVTLAGQPADELPSATLRGVIDAPATFPHSIPAIARGLQRGHGPAVVMAGILLLLITPVVRVAGAVLTFAHERDRTFVTLSSVVLVLLFVSFLVGRAGG